MTKKDNVFADAGVRAAMLELCKALEGAARERNDDVHFLTFAMGLKGGVISTSRAGCRCFACAMAAGSAIIGDAMQGAASDMQEVKGTAGVRH